MLNGFSALKRQSFYLPNAIFNWLQNKFAIRCFKEHLLDYFMAVKIWITKDFFKYVQTPLLFKCMKDLQKNGTQENNSFSLFDIFLCGMNCVCCKC